MASIEPSEELLDRHFRQQVAIYKDVDLARAFQSDRLIMARWMKVFERTPLSQKLARNSLMLLMHGHMKDFGFLKEPFTDVRNCSRNLNEILDVYKGHSCKKEQKRIGESKSSSSSRNVSVKRTFTHIPRSMKLEPIKEVSEPSEKEPTTSSIASIVTIIERAKTRSISSQTSSSSQKTCPECVTEVEGQSVRKRVQDLEEGLSNNEEHPLSVSSMENMKKYYQKWASYSGDSASNRESERATSTSQERLQKITNVIDQVTRRSSAVKNLKDCFEEMAERLRNTSEPEYSISEGRKPKIPPPAPPKNFRRIQDDDVPVLMARQTGGKSLPKDKPVQSLLIRREKLRVQCLEYYNLDGTMKDVKDMPATSIDTKRTDLRVKGFIIGAYRALERVKRWRGKPNHLRLFKTCFRGCGLKDFGRLQALDRRFEQVALKWYRKKLFVCQQNTWRRYRRNILAQKPSPTKADLLQIHHQLELKEELQRERMVHLAKIRDLCKINCSGVVRPEVHRKMLSSLNNEYDQLAEDLKLVVLEKEQLFQ
nr:uncharacterized protein LOC108012583 isoform X2 [Drosophila suzukii]